jgi:hypothetical protein
MAAAGLVVVPEHAPLGAVASISIAPARTLGSATGPLGRLFGGPAVHALGGGLARWLYDVLLILSWGLLIVGGILVLVGLIRTWQDKPAVS